MYQDKENLLNVNQEDYTRKEKSKFLFVEKILSFLLILTSIAESVLSFLLDDKYQYSATFYFGIFLSIQAFFAIIFFVWSFTLSKELKKSEDKWAEESDTILGRITLIFSVIFFLGSLTINIIVIIWRHQAFSYYLAANGSENYQAFRDNYLIFEICIAILTIINLIILGYSIFTSYINAGSPNTFRILLYILSFIHTFVAFTVIYFAKEAMKLKSVNLINKAVNFLSIELIIVMTVIAIVIVFVTLFINFKRWRSLYLVMGTILLIVSFVLMGSGGKVFQSSNSLLNNKVASCQTHLKKINSADLKTYGCENKYLKGDSSNCPLNHQTIVFEKQKNTPISKQINQIACLNMKCCGVVSRPYQNLLIQLGVLNLILISISFAIICCCYFLTNKYSGQKSLPRSLEIAFIFLCLVLLIVGIALCIALQIHLPVQENVVSTNTPKFKHSNYNKLEHYPKSVEYVPITCKKFSSYKSYNPTISLSNCINSVTKNGQKICHDGVRVSIASLNAKIKFKKTFNSKTLFFFDSSVDRILFPDLKNKESYNFLTFQGKPDDIKSFLKNELHFCPLKGKQPTITLLTTQVDLKTNKHSKESVNYFLQKGNQKSFLVHEFLSKINHHLSTKHSEIEYVEDISQSTEKQTINGKIERKVIDPTAFFSLADGNLIYLVRENI